ncbi:MAG: DUF882 domain-containing protein [Pseudolabrys sp.]|nr:DUF882 domain-containing protein [Pseudolabrys sp.]
MHLARAGRTSVAAATLLLAANTSLQTAAAEGDTRTLSFHHVHTGEDITVTFKRNGRYDDAALKKLNWFMRDWRKELETTMDPHLFDLLWEAYRSVGGTAPIQVICGYRSPDTNKMLRDRSESSGVAQFSLHTQGDAMDFNIPGASLEAVREIGLKMQRGGVGFYPTSGSPFIHMDTGAVRHWPRMSREQLVRVFPDQRTVHVPSDGVPLAGYALALAEVEKRGNEPNDVSLAAARNAGIIGDEDRTASVPKKRSLFAALFGKKEDPAKDEPAKLAVRETVAVAKLPAHAPAPLPLQVATERIVPVPKGRPVVVASIAPMPTPHPRPAIATAQNPVEQRGLWPLEVASADPNAAAALAYAADKYPAARRASPMGATVGYAPANEPVEEIGDGVKSDRLARASFDNRFQTPNQGPWLRAMILTPSVTATMTATRLGALNAQPLAEMMRKPSSAIVMTFADDPHYGLQTAKFSGNAVVFLATATFGMRTASLSP